MTKRNLEEIQRSDPFYSPDTNIDLRGYPDFQSAPPDTNWIDERFGQLDTRGSGDGSRQLKEFVSQEIALAEGTSTVNLGSGVIGEVSFDAGEWSVAFEHDGQRVGVKGTTRDEACIKASRLIADKKPDVIEPTEPQLRYVAALAQSAKMEAAILKYLSFAIPRRVSDRTLLSDPRYAKVLDEAVWFVWSQGNNEYSLSDQQFPVFLEDFAAGKRFTVELLNAAWRLFKEQNSRQQRVALFQPEEPTPQDIDDLPDSEVTRLYHGSLREMARR